MRSQQRRVSAESLKTALQHRLERRKNLRCSERKAEADNKAHSRKEQPMLKDKPQDVAVLGT